MKKYFSMLAVWSLVLSGFSVWAGGQVPFKASFSTEFTSVAAYPLVYVQVAGAGQASHLGSTLIGSTDQIVDLSTGIVTATYWLTAANGDQLAVSLLVHATFVPDGLAISGGWTALGGTGRFANATGGGDLEGFATFTGPDTGVDHFQMTGFISSPGKSKK